MVVYILLLLLIVVLLSVENKHNSHKFALYIFLCVFSLFALRDYSVGIDTRRYITEFVYESSDLRQTDFGFAKYNEFLRSIGISSTRLFLVISSFIICFPVFYYISKCSNQKMLTYYLYITIGTFTIHLTGMRQSIAMGLVILGYTLALEPRKILFLNKSLVKYTILILSISIAVSFHASAMICYLYVPMLWFSEHYFIRGKLWLYIIPILPLLFPLTSISSMLASYYMTSRYENYEVGVQRINIVAFFVIPYTIFLYAHYLYYKFSPQKSYEIFCYFCSIAFVFSAASSMFMPIFARFGYYFSLPTLSFVAVNTCKLSLFDRRFVCGVMIVVCFIYFYLSTVGGILQIENYSFSID